MLLVMIKVVMLKMVNTINDTMVSIYQWDDHDGNDDDDDDDMDED